jgi:undecaprenyl diphosphate synthase
MDGNGRWAKDRGLERPVGHREGMKTVIDVVKGSTAIGLKAITLYAFSEQNWARPEDEVGGLMKLIVEYLISEREMFFRDQVRLRAIGRISRLPPVEPSQGIDAVVMLVLRRARRGRRCDQGAGPQGGRGRDVDR